MLARDERRDFISTEHDPIEDDGAIAVQVLEPELTVMMMNITLHWSQPVCRRR